VKNISSPFGEIVKSRLLKPSDKIPFAKSLAVSEGSSLPGYVICCARKKLVRQKRKITRKVSFDLINKIVSVC